MMCFSSWEKLFPVFVNNAFVYVNDFKKNVVDFGMNTLVSKFTYFMFSLLKKLTLYLSDFNIFHWIILSSLSWLILHGTFVKCMKVLLKRIGVNVEDRNRLVKAIWCVCFAGISVPVLVTIIGATVMDLFVLGGGGWLDHLQYQMDTCKIKEDISVPGVKTIFVIHTSFFIQDLVCTWQSKGFKNFEFLHKQVFLSVFILTYYTKCPLLGLSVLFLINRAILMEYLSKLSCLLARFTHSVALKLLSKALCVYYLLLWSAMYLYTLPSFLLANKTIDSGMMKAELKVLITMDFLMWIYFIASVFDSIASRIILSFTLASDDRPGTLEYFLFGSDPWIKHITALNYDNPLINEQLEEDDKTRRKSTQENMRVLQQTIRCSILLKRKIRRMREEKERRCQAKLGSLQISVDSNNH